MKRYAHIEGPYRYTLARTWGHADRVLFIMLNPSIADANQDDPTIRRCINYARLWGFEGLYVGNLFAWRATDPKDLADALKRGEDCVGPRNHEVVDSMALASDLIVCAWGAHGARFQVVVDQMLETLESRTLFALGRTRTGHPKHPLYLKRDLFPRVYRRPYGDCYGY